MAAGRSGWRSDGMLLALDQGTTSTRAILFDADADARGPRTRWSCRSTSRARAGWSTTPEDLVAHSLACLRGALERPAPVAAADGRHRHHQPARDDAPLGPRHGARGRTPRSSGRTAAAPAICDAAAGGGPGGRCSPSARGCSPTPISPRTKLAWLLDAMPGAAGARPSAGALLLRHGGQLAALAPDRRRACTPPTRPTPRAPCSTTSAAARWDDDLLRAVRHPARPAAGGAGLRGRVRETDASPARRRRRRSAASPATSRRRRSGRPASRRAWRSPPTARAASCC